jgi:hypothetical protein
VRSARATLAAALFTLWCAPAAAQAPGDRPVHRVEVSVGALWVAGGELGAGTAVLRANQVPQAPFTLFSVDTRVTSSPGFDGRIGFWLTRSLVVEGGFVYAQPAIRTRVSGDVEGAEAIDLEENLDQYFIDASASLLLDRLALWAFVPFVQAGGGYLRQLHEGRTLVESGQVYHVGGGVRRWLRVRDRGFIHALGVRVDGRAYVLRNGFSIADGPRSHGAISGALFVTF